ncbi:MAG TPA: RNA-guided endonuclease IscB [Oligoflexus sp.]|uniref:RNA-guided endonuclease IscB n=1 Tax=Oligoflexus sp. TaxID=1971216 RepID=UPI002D7E7EDD|nr:RNA-guided endonuclease IscB [Oligoflexus sp.]HET9237608.1 RNA-guided endonuclease IscB [Oligoflexus sp.]
MQRVLVLSHSKRALMPCHPARAKELLKKRKAAVYRRFPFTIILKNRADGDVQLIELKVDPGSRTTGLALVGDFRRGKRTIFAANLSHRGQAVKDALEARRSFRRSRRARKTRYRAPRFLNRLRSQGWLPPSLRSRVDNVQSWAAKLIRFSPVCSIAVETVRFDMQKMDNPEISGVEYQQGTLLGYEVREYLLEKWARKCAYCQKEGIPLEVEHIHAKSLGGSNRISNLTLACRACNKRKGNRPVEDFLRNNKDLLARILIDSKTPLKDAAAVNASRYAIGNALGIFSLPISFWSGGMTKSNRSRQKYHKDHWVDAACVGESGEKVFIHPRHKPLLVKAESRGSRLKCLPDRYGFPRTSPKAQKRVFGFQTGDFIEAKVTKGKKIGCYQGRVAVRSTGSFNVKVEGKVVQGISHNFCRVLQRVDGYSYAVNS